jgi:hypothetical protein
MFEHGNRNSRSIKYIFDYQSSLGRPVRPHWHRPAAKGIVSETGIRIRIRITVFPLPVKGDPMTLTQPPAT